MSQLDDRIKFVKVHSFHLPEAFTYGNMRKTQTDKDKRRRIRAHAAGDFPSTIPCARTWGFRIHVKKSGKRPFDIENVAKLIIDAFSKRQMHNDRAAPKYHKLCLFDDDTIDHVNVLEVSGERTEKEDSMSVEIFASLQYGSTEC